MNLEPFLNAGLVIQIHIVSAVLSLILGAMLLWRRKGTPVHKINGKIWVALMAIVALSSFFINDIRTFGPFSAIHILSIVALVSLFQIVRYARLGKIRHHQNTVKGLFYGGLIGAGVFTFFPGRIMYQTFFGKPEFYLSSVSNAWIMPVSLALFISLFVYWRARRT